MAYCFKLSLDKTEVNERDVDKDDGNIDNFGMGFFSWFSFMVKVNYITESPFFRFFPLIGVIFGIENKKKKGMY